MAATIEQQRNWIQTMTMAEYSVSAFALLNAARTVAYLPQLVRIHRDPNGAIAVSIMTWLLFTSANVATVAYAVLVSGDRLVAAIFCLNTVGCGAVALLTLAKRLNMRHACAGSLATPGSWFRLRTTSRIFPPRSDDRGPSRSWQLHVVRELLRRARERAGLDGTPLRQLRPHGEAGRNRPLPSPKMAGAMRDRGGDVHPNGHRTTSRCSRVARA